MSSASIGILVEAQDKATATLKRVEEQLGSMQKQMQESSKKSEGLLSSFKKLAIGATALAGAWKAFNFMKESVGLYHQAETAMTRLATITNNATGATQEQVQALFDQANALEKVGVVDKTTIMNGMAKLATFDLQTKSISELTPRLLDLVAGEYGLSASSEQIANTANGLGKALQGNVELFTKQGFIVSEAQKEMLKYGTEAERVATINEILGTTYDGLNEKLAETSEGKLLQMQNRMSSLKEEIGRQLTPTVNGLMIELGNLLGMAENNANGFNSFGEVVYRMTNFLIAMGKATALVVQVGTGLVDVVGGAVVDSFKAVGGSVKNLVQGQFTEAWETLKKGSEEGGDKVVSKTKAWTGVIKDQFDSIGESALKAFDLKGFDTSFNFFGKKTDGAGAGGGVLNTRDIENETKKVMAELDRLGKSYEDFAEKADDALFALDQSHKEKLASIADSMKNVRSQIQKLNEEYEKTKQNNINNVAEAVVANELKMAELQKSMQGDISQERYNEIQEELRKREEAVKANADFIQSIEGAVAEARRVASLSDFERAIEEYEKKKLMAEQEYSQKLSLLKAELNDLKRKRDEENALYREKRNFIYEMEASITERHAQTLESGLKMTKDAVTKEIEYYRMLAEAIGIARSGNADSVARIQSKVQKVNDAIITKNGDVIQTHPDDYIIATKTPEKLGGKGSINININGGMYLDQNSARKIGDEIIKALELQFKY